MLFYRNSYVKWALTFVFLTFNEANWKNGLKYHFCAIILKRVIYFVKIHRENNDKLTLIFYFKYAYKSWLFDGFESAPKRTRENRLHGSSIFWHGKDRPQAKKLVITSKKALNPKSYNTKTIKAPPLKLRFLCNASSFLV